MCGRLNLSVDPADLADELEVGVSSHVFAERYNVPPGGTVPVLVDRPEPTGEIVRRLEPARWGLVPGWARDLKIGFRAFNARAETVHEKPMFRAAFGARRCAVAVRGYYEWEATEAGKTPWLMESAGSELLLMAGLYEFRRLDPEDRMAVGDDAAAKSGWLVSTTIITTEAQGHLREVHDRMPVMLTPEQMATWNAPEAGAAEARALLDGFIEGFVPETVTRRRVDPAIGNVRNEGPDLVRPGAWAASPSVEEAAEGAEALSAAHDAARRTSLRSELRGDAEAV